MADLLEQASSWLDEQRIQHMSKLVSYQRGEASIDVLATIGRWTFEVDDGTGILEKIESRDFLISASHLVFDSEQVLPQRGDRIKETQGDKVYVYEVLTPGKEVRKFSASSVFICFRGARVTRLKVSLSFVAIAVIARAFLFWRPPNSIAAAT